MWVVSNTRYIYNQCFEVYITTCISWVDAANPNPIVYLGQTHGNFLLIVQRKDIPP